MKRILTAAALALLASTAAQADNTTRLYAGGAWATDHIAQNGDGKPMCLVECLLDFPRQHQGPAHDEVLQRAWGCSCTSANRTGSSSPAAPYRCRSCSTLACATAPAPP